MAALLANQIDVLAGGGTGGVVAQLQGFTDLAIFGTNVHTWVFAVYTVPAITEAAQLRGKKMGVTRFGGTMDFAARYFLKGQGLEPGKDVALIQVGSSPDIVTALANGIVDSGMMSVPYLFVARRLGLRELADLSGSGVRYAQAALVAKRSFLKEKQDVVGRFIKGLIEATRFLKTRPAEGMRVLGRYTRTDDQDILKQAYDYHVQRLLSRVPDIRPDDVRLLLEEAALTNPKARGANPQDFIDEGPVRDVVRSGFVDRLYGK
jgi:ABC-type nitrate/sulfonate/bicarbonate transport system substrate-binding protein